MAVHEIKVTIGAKDEATKQIKAIDKELVKLTKQKAEIDVEADTDAAVKAIGEIDGAIEDLQRKRGEIEVEAKVSGALSALDDVATEAEQAERAAEALSRALGPELTAGADMDQVIDGFRRMDLSMEDIIQNADRLGGKLREVSSTGTGDLSASFGKARKGLDDVAGSADRAQTGIGTLRGVTDEFGGAAGQVGTLGAALVDAGETIQIFGQQLGLSEEKASKLAGVIGTVGVAATAALAIGVTLARTAMDAFSASAKHNEADVKAWADAMKDGGDGTDEMSANLQNLTRDAKESGGAFKPLLDALGFLPAAITRAVGGPEFGILADNIDGIQDALARAGVTSDTFWRLVTDERGTGAAQLRQMMKAAGASIEDQNAVVDAALEKTLAWLDAQDDEVLKQRLLRKSVDDATDSYKDFVDAKTGIEDMPETWDLIADAILRMRDGLPMTAQQLQAVNDLIAKGVPPDSIWSTGEDVITERSKAQADALDQSRDALEKWREEQEQSAQEARDFAVSLAEAEGALAEMASEFNIMARRGDALSSLFDLGDAPLEALQATQSVHDAIRDLGTFIRENGVPDIFDPNDLDASAFLAKMESLRTPIQQAVTEAFAAGGPAAATQVADGYVRQITESMRGRLTSDQVRTLLGLGDLQVKLDVAMNMASLEEARQLLSILTGLTGATPWTAQVYLDLAAGKISPAAAKILLAQNLGQLSVDVDSALLPPPGASTDAATREAEAYARAHPADMATSALTPSQASLVAARNAGQSFASRYPIYWPVQVQTPRQSTGFNAFRNPFGFDAGGRAGRYGGIAAERGAEILDGKYLATSPTYIPPGTRVTSRVRTERILRTRAVRGLRRYDSGGVVPAAPVTVNVSAAVIGNRYDVMRAVKRANLDRARLLGTRG